MLAKVRDLAEDSNNQISAFATNFFFFSFCTPEFYRTTQYGRDYAIGRNCRFLQGPKSDKHCVARMSAAVKSGQEFSEVLLN